jgi:hypothetical protein
MAACQQTPASTPRAESGSPVSKETGPAIITHALQDAFLSRPYEAKLTAANVPAPYTWSITQGALPGRFKLEAKSGQIIGTPAEPGAYSFTVAALDRKKQLVASKDFQIRVLDRKFDAYGGLSELSCERGPQPHFYAERSGNRWRLCTPAGHVFWMNGVYHVDASDSGKDSEGIALGEVVDEKYRRGATTNSTLNWALQSVRRLQSWGFNTLAEYANAWTLPIADHSDWQTPDQTIPVKLPFLDFIAPSMYSMSNSGNYADGPVKDLIAGVKTEVYDGYRSQSIDCWDPRFEQWLRTSVAEDRWIRQSIAGKHKEYLIGFVVDDTDNLQGFGAGPDFPTVSNGVAAPGYDQPHLGWIILVTAPEQAENRKFGAKYKDPTVYSKKELGAWLSARYGGKIGSLNAAWGSKYTSFGSSGGWGKGSGVLDEDGTCPARAGGPCWVPADSGRLQGAAPGMQKDLSDFLLHHAEKYFSTIKGVLNSVAPGVMYTGPTVLGTWSAPPRREILQAASKYLDVINLSTTPPVCSNCKDLQQRVDFVATYGGDKPWISWEGYPAPSDSYMSKSAAKTDFLSTQAARGQLYQRRMEELLDSHDTAGTRHFVGLKWWELYDNRGENMNWGLITRRDDPYDGVSSSPTAGADSWGYPTGCLARFGCEQKTYGDFVQAVKAANFKAFETLFPAQSGKR